MKKKLQLSAHRSTPLFGRRTALILATGFALVATSASAHDPTTPAPPTHEIGKEHGSLSEVSHKLSDPTSNMWVLFTEFDLTFSDGDVNTGDAKVGGDMNFQPVWGNGLGAPEIRPTVLRLAAKTTRYVNRLERAARLPRPVFSRAGVTAKLSSPNLWELIENTAYAS